MANLKTDLCGIQLKSPFVMGSGPCGWDAEALALCSKAGCGAVITKSLSIPGAVNTTRHMISNGTNSLINNEAGSDMPLTWWRDEQIKKAKDLGVECLIASIDCRCSNEDAIMMASVATEAGADMVELVGDYLHAGAFVDLARAVRGAITKPIMVKVNANWGNTADVAHQMDEVGVDAISGIDSIGPGYRVDIKTGRSALGGPGYGFMTGAPILPLSLYFIHDMASSTKKPLVGLGGVTNAEAAMEMLMAGATHVGVCTAAIVNGPGVFTKLCDGLSKLMDQLGYPDIASVSGVTLRNEGRLPEITPDQFRFDKEACVKCGKCVTVCPYRARSFDAEGNMLVNAAQCRKCGLCFTVCPKSAISVEE